MNDTLIPNSSAEKDISAINPQAAQKLGQEPAANYKKKFWFLSWPKYQLTTRKQWIIGGIVVAVLLVGGGLGGRLIYKKVTKPVIKASSEQKVAIAPKPTTEASRLSGIQIAPELNKRPVTGVMIENSPDARPQSGLKDAGVVFEAQAEGGITRFLALFLEGQPDHLGPVRSVRPYYLDWLVPFDASVAHAGGSGEALAQIRNEGIKDLDQFANSGAYRRVDNRYAPHNLYTDMAGLDKLNQAKGYTASSFTSWPRNKAGKAATVPTARSIDLNVSSFIYNPHYDYDAPTNSYKRSEGGAPHMDEKSNSQLTPKIVIALVVPRSNDGIYSVYQTNGSGVLNVFQDGIVVKGIWSKGSRKDQLVFKNEAGTPLRLDPGQTWISVVPDAGAITYQP